MTDVELQIKIMTTEISRHDLNKMSIKELYGLEDNVRILRDESCDEKKEDLEELLFDIRMIRRLRN